MREINFRPMALLLSVGILASVLLSGCEQVWYLTVASAANDRPEFCIARSKECTGEGVQLSSVVISEVDEKGEHLRRVWSIGRSEVARDHVIKRLVYGVVPAGWTQDAPAIPLRRNSYYSVNDQFFFVLSGEAETRVYSLPEFSKKNKISAILSDSSRTVPATYWCVFFGDSIVSLNLADTVCQIEDAAPGQFVS